MTVHTLMSKKAYVRAPSTRYGKRRPQRISVVAREYVQALERMLAAIEQYCRQHGLAKQYESATAREKNLLALAREKYYTKR